MIAETKPTNAVEFAKALADPTRQEIMSLICCRELNVSTRNEGKHTFYTLNQSRVVLCCGNLIEVFAPQTAAADIITESSIRSPKS
jgi:DNA-binding transcriptional ArsR family regulator